jgi:predicted TIM-barrel fold metal-dependent hydrolase
MAVQMHFIPGQARAIHELAAKFSETTVILDHMGRPGQGTGEEYAEVLKLAMLPRVILKYSGWDYYKGDMSQLTKRLYDTFGPDRMFGGCWEIHRRIIKSRQRASGTCWRSRRRANGRRFAEVMRSGYFLAEQIAL